MSAEVKISFRGKCLQQMHDHCSRGLPSEGLRQGADDHEGDDTGPDSEQDERSVTWLQ